MNLDERISRTKELIAKREDIDAELSQLLGITPKPKRRRLIRQDASGDTDHGGSSDPLAASAK